MITPAVSAIIPQSFFLAGANQKVAAITTAEVIGPTNGSDQLVNFPATSKLPKAVMKNTPTTANGKPRNFFMRDVMVFA